MSARPYPTNATDEHACLGALNQARSLAHSALGQAPRHRADGPMPVIRRSLIPALPSWNSRARARGLADSAHYGESAADAATGK